MDKVTNQLNIVVPMESIVDEGDGVVSFPNGLTITDGSVQRNGTRYDIDSLDISRYGNQLTGDHKDELGNLIGETIGVVKQNGKVVINKIRYAVNENPYARLAYDLLRGGFSKNFSTETIGPAPDEYSGIYWNAELVGLSQVVTQNNYNAHVNKFNEVVHNSLEQSKNDGLDVEHNALVQNFVKTINSAEEEKMEKETKETETKVSTTEVKPVEETPVVAPVNEEQSTKVEAPAVVDAPKETEVVKPTEVPEVKNEGEKAPAVEKAQEDNGKKVVETPHDPNAPVGEVQKDEERQVETEKETNIKDSKMDEDKKVETQNGVTAAEVAEIVANALKPFATELKETREEAKNAFDKSAKEPEFQKEDKKEVAKNDYASMDFETRYQTHVDAAWNYLQNGNIEAGETLRAINKVNLDALKKEGIAKNAMDISDLGNFVIAPEMYNEIAGHRNDYTAILNATEWKETLSLEFAWLERVGDIDMKSVALHATDAAPNGNLKPISEYSAVPRKSSLEELAAVTVVATSATRFAAVDLLSDAAAGYRNDYDRKRAQLVIFKLEDAIDRTGYSVGYNPSTDVDALTVWIEAVTEISDTTLNGTLIFNARTFAELKSRALKAGANGPLSEILTTGDLPTVFGYRFIIVPNDLMPSLGGSEDIRFTVDGVEKRIQHAVFFADLTTFTGRTSGGLQYDVSNSAPYEVGGVTRSAYQRNELVLRGSFFRGGAVKDVEVVSGVRQSNSANVS